MKETYWISVNDKLPEFGEYVFIAIEMKYNHETQMETAVDIGWLNEDGDFDMINDWYEGQQHFKITHWQKIVLPKKRLIMNEETLFKQICERCENHAKNMVCEDMNTCPAYNLYLVAKRKNKVIYKRDEWQTPPPPRSEMI